MQSWVCPRAGWWKTNVCKTLFCSFLRFTLERCAFHWCTFKWRISLRCQRGMCWPTSGCCSAPASLLVLRFSEIFLLMMLMLKGTIYDIYIIWTWKKWNLLLTMALFIHSVSLLMTNIISFWLQWSELSVYGNISEESKASQHKRKRETKVYPSEHLLMISSVVEISNKSKGMKREGNISLKTHRTENKSCTLF